MIIYWQTVPYICKCSTTTISFSNKVKHYYFGFILEIGFYGKCKMSIEQLNFIKDKIMNNCLIINDDNLKYHHFKKCSLYNFVERWPKDIKLPVKEKRTEKPNFFLAFYVAVSHCVFIESKIQYRVLFAIFCK